MPHIGAIIWYLSSTAWLISLSIESWNTGKNPCAAMFIAAQFAVAKCWKQPQCPSVDEWIHKLCTFTQWNVCLSFGTARKTTAGKSMSHFTAGLGVEAVVGFWEEMDSMGLVPKGRKPEDPPGWPAPNPDQPLGVSYRCSHILVTGFQFPVPLPRRPISRKMEGSTNWSLSLLFNGFLFIYF